MPVAMTLVNKLPCMRINEQPLVLSENHCSQAQKLDGGGGEATRSLEAHKLLCPRARAVALRLVGFQLPPHGGTIITW